jgi:hypothetical protein
MQRTIVGIAGPIGSGKSTIAGILTSQFGFSRVRFAGPLKNMMTALGLSVRQVDGDLKEVPSDLLCGKTPRHAMQTIGTEWGRDLIGNDLWINAWKASVERLPGNSAIVVDDVRFPNEADAIREAGGVLLMVTRGVTEAALAGVPHASEVFDFDPDCHIVNNGTIEHLEGHVRTILRGLTSGAPLADIYAKAA